jgi:hypothetical protein
MTAIGRLEMEFNAFKAEMEKRLSALENKEAPTTKEEKPKKKTKDILLETNENDIVGSEI